MWGHASINQSMFNQSINQCYICSNVTDVICSNEIHREFMPAIHQKSLVWLILTFSTSPSKTTLAGVAALRPT
jgi:hypothetical protein